MLLNFTLSKIVYEAVRGSSFTGDIALDDIGVVVGDCPIRGIDDCDFETPNICGYTQDQTDTFDWTRRSGSTPSAGTGPSVDHTLGTSTGKNRVQHYTLKGRAGLRATWVNDK